MEILQNVFCFLVPIEAFELPRLVGLCWVCVMAPGPPCVAGSAGSFTLLGTSGGCDPPHEPQPATPEPTLPWETRAQISQHPGQQGMQDPQGLSWDLGGVRRGDCLGRLWQDWRKGQMRKGSLKCGNSSSLPQPSPCLPAAAPPEGGVGGRT